MALSPIITTDELLKIMDHDNVMIFDVSSGKNAYENYLREHIKGAYFIDLNTQLSQIKNDASKGGRHPLPTIEQFSKTLTDFGVTKDTHIIIYDDSKGANAAARFWWMLRAVGHHKVQVLNGGFQYAQKNHFPMSHGEENLILASTPYHIDQWILPTIQIEDVEKIHLSPDYKIIDVRDQLRYEGKTEPIDLIAGHIPGAINIPLTENLDQEGLFLSPEVLKEKYSTALNNTSSVNTIIHCGSGVTACHTILAMDYAELPIPKLYVGSWSEWSRNDLPIATTQLI